MPQTVWLKQHKLVFSVPGGTSQVGVLSGLEASEASVVGLLMAHALIVPTGPFSVNAHPWLLFRHAPNLLILYMDPAPGGLGSTLMT